MSIGRRIVIFTMQRQWMKESRRDIINLFIFAAGVELYALW